MSKSHPGARDFSEAAVAVVDFLIEKYDTVDADPPAESAHAIAGRKGGRARAAAMTPAERSASARRAALARWGKKVPA